MKRLWSLTTVLTCLIAVTVTVAEDQPNKKLAILDLKEAGPDFQIQGEYIGKIGEYAVGVQVVAKGGGKFESVTYSGGLPGAGFNGERKIKATWETKDGVVKSTGDGWDAAIANGTLTVNFGGGKAELKRIHRESPTLAKSAPEGALVLFNGSNAEQWEPPRLTDNGLMGVGTRTKKSFEDFTLHLEFRTPYMPNATGQGRGNSGMYLGDQYECQILDSFGLEGEDNECGGIYKNSKPKLNMCFPPLSWQTYDVDFTCAKFDAEGKTTSPAKVTIKHNGVVIHENLEITPTPGGGRNDAKPGALFLQDHHDPVRFRNIWIVEKK